MTTGAIVWFTGLSGAGKSTLAQAVRRRWVAIGREVEVLDGDVVRAALSPDLGFSRADRDVNVARLGYVAQLLAQHGVVVLVAAISPYRAARDAVRARAEAIGVPFIEVFADATIDALIARDRKDLYRRACNGEVPHFTGVSDPYECPLHPDVHVRTDRESIAESVARIWAVCVSVTVQPLSF